MFRYLLPIIATILSAAIVHAQDSLFAPPVNHVVGDYPVSVFSADFDGDGDFDLAVANLGSDNVSILLNNGDGTFAASVNYGAGDGPHSVFSADFDEDGDLDLAVVNAGSDNVSILLNNGDGIFQEAVNYGIGSVPYSVFSTDLDGDGDYDLAVANRSSNNVSILNNSGDGTFQAAGQYAVGNGPWSVFSADFDGDGALDLVTANRDSDNTSVLLNNGDGTFSAAVNYAAGNGPHSVFSADFDGDGDFDLAVANLYSDNISVLENNGSGMFLAPVNYGVGNGAASVFSFDFDDDNHFDLAVANAYSKNVSTLINNGDGTFQAAVNYGVGDGPVSAFSADFDEDGDLDLVVTNQDSDNVSVLMNLTIREPPTNEAGRYLWVPNYGDNTVSKVDVETHAVVASIPVAGGPSGIAVGRDYVYITHRYSSYLYRISKDLDIVYDSIDLSGIMELPIGVAVDSLSYTYVVGREYFDAIGSDLAFLVKIDPQGFIDTSISLFPIDLYSQLGTIGVGLSRSGTGFLPWRRAWDMNTGIVQFSTADFSWTNYPISYLYYRGQGVGIDSDGNGWTAGCRTSTANISRLEPDVGLTHYSAPAGWDDQRGGVVVDPLGAVWVGTGTGLVKLNPLTQEVDQLNVGRVNGGLACDTNGYIWAVFPDSNKIKKFDLSGNQVGSSVEVGLSPHGFGDMTGYECPRSHVDTNDILVYITEDGTGYGYDKNYFNDGLPAILSGHGYSATITDRISTPEITDSMLLHYDELWILSTNPFSSGCFSTGEITTVLAFRDSGKGLLIMADHEDPTYDYQDDANQISIPLGVTFYGNTNHGPHGNEIIPTFSEHFLSDGVESIVGGANEGNMNISGSADIIATYQGDNLIAVLDDGNGRAVFDVSITRLWDDGVMGCNWISVGNTPQYVRNIADWLAGGTPSTAPKLALSSAPFFDGITGFHPLSGDESTLFEFRINYQDSSNFWPELGYPQLILDWDGNGVIDDANDGYYAMSQSESDSVFVDGADYSVFTAIPASGSPQIRFEAISSSGLSAVYPESGWLSGPSVVDSNDTDLYLYADDITFSVSPPDRPEVGEPVVIYGRVHNNSLTGFDSVRVDLYIDEVLARSFYEFLPARDADGNAGFADIAFDTVFNEIAFVQVAITVDPEDVITEWNEFNNTARRSLIIEGFQLPGAIHLSPFALGTYYPMSWVSGGGTAWYEDQGDSLEELSGTPVYLKLIEGNVDLDTVYVNDLGYFSYSFMTPLDTGFYHIELKVTDFTLDAIDTVSFHVVPAQWPDLVIDYDLGGFPLTMCGNTDLTIYGPRVVNVGSLPSGPCKAAVMHGSTTLIDVNVPALDPGEFFVLAPNDLTVTHSVEGYYRVSAVVDYDHEVAEWSEWNNSKWTDYRVWCCPEDLQPTDLKLSGVGRPGRPVNILAKVYNQGGQASDGFSLTFVDMCCGLSLTDTVSIGTTGNLSLAAYGSYGWYPSGSYVFSDTGMHLVQVYADSGNTIPECREDNNVYSEWIYIQSMIDLYTSYDSIIVDNPDAGEGEPVHLQAKIGNAGDLGAYAFCVYFGLNGSGYTANPDVFVDSLPGGTDLLVEHPETWTVDFSHCSLGVFVDSGNQVAEYNEGNNRGVVPLPYDFYPHYGYRCPQSGKPSPYFFDTCGPVDTGVAVTVALTAKNAALLRFNDSLLFSVYDSVSGEPSPTLIHSRYVYGPYEDHARNLVVDSFVHSFTQYGTHFVTVVVNADHVVAECNYDNNEAMDSIIVEPHLPDLVIQSEWIDPSSLNPQLGEEFWISNVDVYNLGHTYAFDVDVLFLLSGDTLDTKVISEIAPGGYDYTGPSDTVVVDTCEPAIRIVRVCADPFGLIEEEDELNNCATRAVVFCEGVDLYVRQTFFEYDCLCVDFPLTINTVIANNGGLDASAIVDFYYTDNPQGGWSERTFLASATVATFEAEDSVTVAIPWQVPATEMYICVDISYSYPWDFNRSNDTTLVALTLAICGDVDGDGFGPDVTDLVYLVDYMFRDGPVPPLMDAADVNCSGGIPDIADLVYLVNYMFRQGPPPCDPGRPETAPKLFASNHAGKCNLEARPLASNHYCLEVWGDFECEVAGFQQEYRYDPELVTVDSVVAGGENREVDLFVSSSGGQIRLGMVDLEGRQSIRAGRSKVLDIYVHTKADVQLDPSSFSHTFTEAVDRQSLLIPLDISTSRLWLTLPKSFALHQNYPNPFNPSTTIEYALPKAAHVKITIFNILGQKVTTLFDQPQVAGYHTVIWSRMTSQGKPAATGIYFYRIEAGEFVDSKKMLLLK